MPSSIRHLLIVLVAAAQIALGSNARGVVCLGGSDGHDGASECSHDGGGEGLRLPAPVEPHDEHEQDCACIDVGTPTGRNEGGRYGADVVRDSAVLVLHPVVIMQPAEVSDSRVAVREDGHPPGHAPGLRTTRLLI